MRYNTVVLCIDIHRRATQNIADHTISGIIEKQGVLKKVKCDLKHTLGWKAGARTASKSLTTNAEMSPQQK